MRIATKTTVIGLAVAICLLGTAAPAAVLTPGGQPDPTWESNAMLLWLKADAGFTPSTWTDQSTYAYSVTQGSAANQPSLAAGSLNGQDTVAFDGNDFMDIASGPSGQQTAFFVYKDTSTAAWVTPLGTTYNGKGSYHGQSNNTGLFNTTYTDPNTLGGGNYRNASVPLGNGTTTPRPNNWVIDAHVATAPLAQTLTKVGADDLGAGRAITGGIAEIIVYNRALTPGELNDVGNYLQGKYGVSWADSPLAYSVPDFSGTQGQNNWQYGHGLGSSFSTAGMTYSTVSSGLLGNPGGNWNNSGNYPKLWDTGAHPADNDAQPATRRWTSEVDGWVKVTGQLAKFDTTAGQDGILGEVRVNGARRFYQDIAGTDGTGVNYVAYVPVQSGQPVDFSVHRKSSYSFDSTKFTAIVETLPAGVQVFDLATDFNTAQNLSTNPWHYVRVDGNARDGTYSLLSPAVTKGVGQGWEAFPGVWKNTSGSDGAFFTVDVVPVDGVAGHPDSNNGVGAAWTAPEGGWADIAGFVALVDGGNSGVANVDWYLDVGDGSGNLLSGSLTYNGNRAESFSIDRLRVEAGEVVYLHVLNVGSLNSDNTQMSMTIALTVPEPGSLALFGIGLIALGGCLGRRRRRRA